jgi:glycine cleavage system H lipoate-binding protein
MVALFVILTIVVFLVADVVVQWASRRKSVASELAAATGNLLAEILPEPELPGGVFLTPSHLMIGIVPSGQARIALDALIGSAFGEPDVVETPVSGTRVRKGQPLFTARWGNRTVVFHSPLDGTVVPPVGEEAKGWLLSIEPQQARRDLGALPMAEEARSWFSHEWARLRDYVAVQAMPAPAMALPDGGKPSVGWMRHEPDSVWDGFVDSFLKG